MRKSIARKLTFRVALLLLAALVILCVGSYHTVRRIILDENERYAQTILSMYNDMIVYEAEKDGAAIDVGIHDEVHIFSEYICEWYRVEYVYLYKLDPDHGTLRYVDFCFKDPDLNDTFAWVKDEEFEYEMTPAIQAVLDGESLFGLVNQGQSFGTVDIIMKQEDSFGNTLIAGIAVSTEKMMEEAFRKFLFLAAVLLTVFVALIFTSYYTVVKKVSRPAKQISKAMTEFIANGQRTDVRLDDGKGDEFGMIASAFNSMTQDIDHYLKDIQNLNEDKADQKSQLETASYIQKGFLPPETYNSKGIEIRAMMNPARDIGGDLYDYLPLDDNRLLFVVADVSGKGMPAAIFMSVTLMLIRQYARTGLSPARILENVNDTLSEQNPRMLFATAFVGIYNHETRQLVFANAGHNPPYILHDTLRNPGTVQNTLLGLFSGERYSEEKVTLQTGDVLFLYTDGVDEATDPENRFYGTERLEQTLREAKASHEENLVWYVYDSLTDFSAGADQHDDITLMTLTVKDTQDLKLGVDLREFSRIRERIMACDLPRQLKLDLCLAAEEIFVNICSYAFKDRNPAGEEILFTLEHSDRIRMRFSDCGIPYDPRESVISADDYDPDLQIGGLGKLIAFTVADTVDYEYTEGHNILTVTKYIKEEMQNDDSSEQ